MAQMNPYEPPQAPLEQLTPPPLWVGIALAGVPSRTACWWYCWFCLWLALAGLSAGFWMPVLFWGSGFVLAAFWYYAAIRWMDKQQRWTPAGRKIES